MPSNADEELRDRWDKGKLEISPTSGRDVIIGTDFGHHIPWTGVRKYKYEQRPMPDSEFRYSNP